MGRTSRTGHTGNIEFLLHDITLQLTPQGSGWCIYHIYTSFPVFVNYLGNRRRHVKKTYPNAPKGSVTKTTLPSLVIQLLQGFHPVYYTRFCKRDLQVVEKTGPNPDFNNAMKFMGAYNICPCSVLSSGSGNKAEATGLKLNSIYFYRVGAIDLWVVGVTFQTAHETEAFTFIDMADTRG